jgi:hypothetical protein
MGLIQNERPASDLSRGGASFRRGSARHGAAGESARARRKLYVSTEFIEHGNGITVARISTFRCVCMS